MENPAGESVDGPLRLNFDRRLKLEFHGSRITSDAGLRATGGVVAVGVAFAMQEVADVPRDATDQPLDWIVTEREARSFRSPTDGQGG